MWLNDTKCDYVVRTKEDTSTGREYQERATCNSMIYAGKYQKSKVCLLCITRLCSFKQVTYGNLNMLWWIYGFLKHNWYPQPWTTYSIGCFHRKSSQVAQLIPFSWPESFEHALPKTRTLAQKWDGHFVDVLVPAASGEYWNIIPDGMVISDLYVPRISMYFRMRRKTSSKSSNASSAKSKNSEVTCSKCCIRMFNSIKG